MTNDEGSPNDLMTKNAGVIPSEVEESRGDTFRLSSRDPSTPLRMTAFSLEHLGFVIPSSLDIRHPSLWRLLTFGAHDK
jgi:hypothetical protein